MFTKKNPRQISSKNNAAGCPDGLQMPKASASGYLFDIPKKQSGWDPSKLPRIHWNDRYDIYRPCMNGPLDLYGEVLYGKYIYIPWICHEKKWCFLVQKSGYTLKNHLQTSYKSTGWTVKVTTYPQLNQHGWQVNVWNFKKHV